MRQILLVTRACHEALAQLEPEPVPFRLDLLRARETAAGEYEESSVRTASVIRDWRRYVDEVEEITGAACDHPRWRRRQVCCAAFW